MFVGHSARLESRFNTAVLLAFIAVTLPAMATHDMWRDEIQAWLIARDSPTPWAIIQNLRYDGHPALWYLLIWPASLVTWAPDAMKPISLAASIGSVALFLWFGPWSRQEKFLWPFGYYVLFEYTVKSRSYCLGIFLLMLFCSLWPFRRKQSFTIAVILGLMANVHVYFGVISAGAALAVAVDRLISDGWRRLFPIPRRDLAAIVLFVVFVSAAVATAAPPATGDYSRPQRPDPSLILVLLGDAIMPAVLLADVGVPAVVVGALAVVAIAWAIVAIPIFLFTARRTPAVLTFFVFSLGILLLCAFLGYPFGFRHAGLFLLVLVAAEWILRQGAIPIDSGENRPLTASRHLRTLFVCQAAVGLATVWFHFTVPYSNGRSVADYVRAQGWAKDPLAGLGSSLTTVCGYLQKPWCYYAERSQKTSFMVFAGSVGLADKGIATTSAVLDRFVADAGTLGRSVTFVIPEPWPDDQEILARHGFRKVRRFGNASVDNYTLYRKGD